MTREREKTIEYIEDIIPCFGGSIKDALKMAIKELKDSSYELWKESYEVEHERNIKLEEAIKALEQQSCEDCVSRQAALDESYAYGYGLEPEGYCVDVEDILALPPVTPTRKKGKWVGDEIYPICSECNCNIIEEYISYSDYAEMYKPMKYCPNCGAEMIERENKE